MTERQKELIAELGLKESDFEPSKEETTIADLVEALDILTSIVLGDE